MQIAMDRGQFAQLREKAGIPAGQTSGEVSQKGVRARWTYANGVLDVEILHKPPMVSEGFIESQFRSWAGI